MNFLDTWERYDSSGSGNAEEKKKQNKKNVNPDIELKPIKPIVVPPVPVVEEKKKEETT